MMILSLLFAATLAVWDADFTNSVLDGVTLDLNGNKLVANGSAIEIVNPTDAPSHGVIVKGFESQKLTVIVGYSNLDIGETPTALITAGTEETSPNRPPFGREQKAGGWNDLVGVAAKPGETTGIYLSGVHTGDRAERGDGVHETASGMHYLAMTVDNKDNGGVRVYGCSKDGWKLLFKNSYLRVTSTPLSRLAIGGVSWKGRNYKEGPLASAKGMRIRRIAVLDEILSLKDIVGFEWPNPDVVHAIVAPRSVDLDEWARSNAEYGKAIVSDLVEHSGSKIEWLEEADETNYLSDAEVLASVFRTPEFEKDYLFPVRPISRMRCAVYARRGRDQRFSFKYYLEKKNLRVGWSPVSQGTPDDRERFFSNNRIKPTYYEYARSEDAVKALARGEVDLIFLYTAANAAPPDADELVDVADRLVFFAVRRDLPVLFERLVDEFDSLLTYRHDVVDRLINQVFGSHLAFTPEEVAWMHDESERGEKILVDISPLVFSGAHRPPAGMQGFAGQLFTEISELTGLKFDAPPSTDVEEAKARFARGETMLWAPYPVKPAEISGADTVFILDFPEGNYPVIANSRCPEILKSILYKAAHSIPQKRITELFLNVIGEREHERQIEIELAGEYKRRLVTYAAIALTITLMLAIALIAALVYALGKSRKARQASELASKAKGRFLSSMSHELRTPLNAILGFADLASRRADDGAYVRGNLEKISTAGEHLLSIINDVLDVSRVEQGRFKIERAEVRLGDIIGEVADLVGSSIHGKGLDFIVEAETVKNDVIPVDRVRIKQVFLNLLGNAIKFTKAGSITFRATSAPGVYRFEVSDTGCGISKEFLPKVFSPFEREDSAATQGVQGTGLGLAITRDIVEFVGGTIACASEQGKGTTFTITIPREKVREEGEKERGERVRGEKVRGEERVVVVRKIEGKLKGRKILVAEDNELNRIVVEGFLNEAGASVEFAVNGAEAVEKVERAKAGEFAVVLMDIQMPVMDGYAAARAIRVLPDAAARKIPILAVSADAFEEDRAKALAAGMNGHVAKPIAPAALYAAIAAVL